MAISAPTSPRPPCWPAQRDQQFYDAQIRFVGLLREKVDTLPDETLDRYRLLGEQSGASIILGDMTGDELAGLCDHEIGARFILRVEAA